MPIHQLGDRAIYEEEAKENHRRTGRPHPESRETEHHGWLWSDLSMLSGIKPQCAVRKWRQGVLFLV